MHPTHIPQGTYGKDVLATEKSVDRKFRLPHRVRCLKIPRHVSNATSRTEYRNIVDFIYSRYHVLQLPAPQSLKSRLIVVAAHAKSYTR